MYVHTFRSTQNFPVTSAFQVTVHAKNDNTVIDLIVENMGRVNYGPHLDSQRKGLMPPVYINDDILPCTVYALDFDESMIKVSY